ncbi:RloB family protein [Variovorax paradoxus]|uniref:RloB family protein n=1 Tax=Variovorax paradoxus TaxID=34073 RepID=UPI002478C42C
MLIVCEGEKTEPEYLKEVRRARQLQAANVQIMPSAFGTDPLNVVRYAKQLFEEGDSHRKIEPRAFDEIFAVFDRDEHQNYVVALQLAASISNTLRNDLRQLVRFVAIASVPCFEIWLLLHFEDIRHPISRSEALQRLRQYLPGYEKGAGSHYSATSDRLEVAIGRTLALNALHNAQQGVELHCDMPQLLAAMV